MTCDALEDIFKDKGVPEICQSDNGSPFQSQEMLDFSRKHGYRHVHITPEWPRANGMIERFNRSMKEAVQAAHLEGKSIKEAADEFVAMYRATPHTATGVSPFEAMHGGRRMKTSLPVIPMKGNTIDREKEAEYKKKMAETSRGKKHELKVGDTVIARQKKENKLTPRFNPDKLTVTKVRGSSVSASDGQFTTFRDASQFKPVESEDEDNEPDSTMAGGRPQPTVDDLPAHNEIPVGTAGEEETNQSLDGGERLSEPAAARPHRECRNRTNARFADYQM